MRLELILCVVCQAGVVADGPPAACPDEAAAIIAVNGRPTGSAVFVNHRGTALLVTAAHVLEGLAPAAKLTANGLPCEVVLNDPKTDLAVLWAGDHAAVDVAAADPRPGDSVTTVGMSAAGTLSDESDTVLSVTDSCGWRNLPGVECRTFPPLGRSGGGLFRNGRLVGVLHVRDPQKQTGVYSRLASLNALLARLEPHELEVYSADWCQFCVVMERDVGTGRSLARLKWTKRAAPLVTDPVTKQLRAASLPLLVWHSRTRGRVEHEGRLSLGQLLALVAAQDQAVEVPKVAPAAPVATEPLATPPTVRPVQWVPVQTTPRRRVGRLLGWR